MKTLFVLFCCLVLLLGPQYCLAQSYHLDVEGHSRIRGNLDINHMLDTTSLFVGRNAGVNTDFNAKRRNTFVGSNAGYSNATGSYNSFFGLEAGYSNAAGSFNSFFSEGAGFNNTVGAYNSFFGWSAGYHNRTGFNNSFFGQQAGSSNTTGGSNSIVGSFAGYLNTSGDYNSFFGRDAGRNNTEGSGNTFLGARSGIISNVGYATAIGYGAIVGCSLCAVIGGTGPNAVKVGIGTTTPQKELDVVGEMIIRDVNQIATFESTTSNSFIEIQNSGNTNGATLGYFDDQVDQYFFMDTPEGSFGELVVLGNGNMGIGQSKPNEKLELKGNMLIRNPTENGAVILSPTNNDYGTNPEFVIQSAEGALGVNSNFHISRNAIFRTSDDTYQFISTSGHPATKMEFLANGDVAFFSAPAGTGTVNFSENVRIASSTGNLGVGRSPATNRLEVEGNASKSSAGDWIANSDARLKKNIHPLDSKEILQKMLALQGITYEWDDDQTGSQRPNGIMYGFTAQNIQEVFPELVSSDSLGYLQTAYGTYDAMYVEAFRAQQSQIKAQQAEITSLREEMNELKQLIQEKDRNRD